MTFDYNPTILFMVMHQGLKFKEKENEGDVCFV